MQGNQIDILMNSFKMEFQTLDRMFPTISRIYDHDQKANPNVEKEEFNELKETLWLYKKSTIGILADMKKTIDEFMAAIENGK